MAIKEEKYMVLKHDDIDNYLSDEQRVRLLSLCTEIVRRRQAIGKQGENKYIVCNQDEPYAEEVWQTILRGEEFKEQFPTVQSQIEWVKKWFKEGCDKTFTAGHMSEQAKQRIAEAIKNTLINLGNLIKDGDARLVVNFDENNLGTLTVEVRHGKSSYTLFACKFSITLTDKEVSHEPKG